MIRKRYAMLNPTICIGKETGFAMLLISLTMKSTKSEIIPTTVPIMTAMLGTKEVARTRTPKNIRSGINGNTTTFANKEIEDMLPK